jgi:hypothetical protein
MPCIHCGDMLCNNGSRCHNGLFKPGYECRASGPHNQTKKHSKRGEFESEHMFPCAALKASGASFNYNHEPTMSIPYGVHRGGVSGSGGGVTSTGSSDTAKSWSAQLGALAKSDNWYDAIRLAAIDQANAAWMQGNLNDGTVSQIIQTVNAHAQLGRLTAEQAAEINTIIYNLYLNRLGI